MSMCKGQEKCRCHRDGVEKVRMYIAPDRTGAFPRMHLDRRVDAHKIGSRTECRGRMKICIWSQRRNHCQESHIHLQTSNCCPTFSDKIFSEFNERLD